MALTHNHDQKEIQKNRRKVRILVVEDDDTSRNLIGLHLSRAGYNVTTAENGAAALLTIEGRFPDVVLTDWKMPEVNGLTLCRVIREQSVDAYVYLMLMTTHYDQLTVKEAVPAGADELLPKPIQIDSLIARLDAITRFLSVERKLRKAANEDALTGIHSRQAIIRFIERNHKLALRDGVPMSVVLCDLDHFHSINQHYGHQVGDEVLKDVARFFAGQVRANDCVGRFGGEEFCFVFNGAPDEVVVQCCERIRQSLHDHKLVVDDVELQVTGSFGIAHHSPSILESKVLLNWADEAVYAAKHFGRNQIIVHGSQAHTEYLLNANRPPSQQSNANSVQSPSTGGRVKPITPEGLNAANPMEQIPANPSSLH